MSTIVSELVNYLKRLLNKKGQGIVEFALLCAFCAAIGLFARDAGFAEVFKESFENSKDDLYWAEIKRRTKYSYMHYFEDLQWKLKKSGELNDSNTSDERILADQKALVKIAETFFGKTENQVLDIMNVFSNATSISTYANEIKCQGTNGTGFSKIVVPLSWSENTLDLNSAEDRTKGWIWLDANNNQNLIMYLTDDKAKVYDKNDTVNNPSYTSESKKKTVTTDRIFYSDNMLTANKGRVTMRLHYTEGRVDFVDIAVRTDNSNTANIADDKLCLHVVESGYNYVKPVNNQNIVNNYDVFYTDSIYYGTQH